MYLWYTIVMKNVFNLIQYIIVSLTSALMKSFRGNKTVYYCAVLMFVVLITLFEMKGIQRNAKRGNLFTYSIIYLPFIRTGYYTFFI